MPPVRGTLFIFATFSALSFSPPSHGDDWPCWHGGQGGYAPSSAPTTWSADEGVKWKAVIPGRGYSSPVVCGDRVYVTTAYSVSRGRWLLSATDYLICLLAAVATFLFVPLLFRPAEAAGPYPDGRSIPVMHSTLRCLAVLVVLALVLFGQRLIGYEKSANRAWFASVVIPVFCAVACVLHSPSRSRWRVLVGLLMIGLFAGGATTRIPGSTADSTPDTFSQQFQLWVCVNALPLIVGGWIAVTWWGGRAGGKPERRKPTHQLVKTLWWVLVSIGGGAVLISIARPIADLDRLRDVSGDNPINPEYALVGWGSLWVTAAVLIGSLALRWTLGRAWRLDALVVVGAAGCLFTLAAKGIEGLTHHSLFLSSLLGTFRREPTIGWWSGHLVAGAGCLSLVLFLAFPTALGSTRRLAVGFRVAMIALGGLTFVNTRYLRTVQEYRKYVRAIVCFGVEDGTVRWVCEALPGPQEPTGRYNSPATPTPVVEGDRVYAYFGTPGLICCDTTGRLRWVNRDLPYESIFGVAASPVVADGLVLITSDPSAGRARVWAVDGASGEVRWVREWAADERMVSGNSRTPVVAPLQGRRALLHWGYDRLRALDVATGEDAAEYRFDPRLMDIVASAVYDGPHLYMAKTGRTDALSLERLATDESPVLWTSRPAGVTCSTPAIARGMLFLVTDGGVATCLDVESGRVRWRERLRGRYFASVVATDERVYFLNDSGQTTVVRCDAEFEELAVNDLREETFATPALASGFLFIRTATTLYCIGR